MTINLPDHALARLPLEYGEELLIVLPVERQPVFRGEGKWTWPNWMDDYDGTEHLIRGLGLSAPHRPDDVLEISATKCGCSRCCHQATEYRLTVQRVECKQVRDVTDIEWYRAGFTGTAWFERNLARGWWDDTYADLDWKSNPWVWLVWAKSDSVKTK